MKKWNARTVWSAVAAILCAGFTLFSAYQSGEARDQLSLPSVTGTIEAGDRNTAMVAFEWAGSATRSRVSIVRSTDPVAGEKIDLLIDPVLHHIFARERAKKRASILPAAIGFLATAFWTARLGFALRKAPA